ncbi:MAG TPA: hypothetical protein VEO95_03090 [Chthoniobacteraceae bacterium]|nr:hypothetical protein [Chthoniobacteraceae bacterium]
MTGEIRELLETRPFVPFTIHLGDGSAIRVPTEDHILVLPNNARVIVATDGDDYHIIAPLLISHLTPDTGSPIANP